MTAVTDPPAGLAQPRPSGAELWFIRADIRPYADESSLVTTPRGATFQVELPAAVLTAVLRAFDGTTTVAEVLAAHGLIDRAAEFAEVVAVLLEDGALRDAAPKARATDWTRFDGTPAAAGITRLLLLGDADLLDLVAPLLPSSLTVTRAATLDEVTDPSSTLVVAVRDQFDGPWLTALDEAAEQRGVCWTQFHLDGGTAFFGPAVIPGRTANYRDLLARRRCAIDETAVFDALTAPSAGDPYRPPASELAWALSAFITDLDRWIAGAPCRTLSTEIEADPLALSLTSHWILPLPDRVLHGEFLTSGPRDTTLLLGERTGIIQRARVIAHDPAIPSRLKTVQTHNANMGRIDPEWANDVICGGSAFDDAEGARHSAIGESVERYCGNYMGQNELRWASWNELTAAGEVAVDPATLVLYSERMYATPGCPYVPFTRDLTVRWVRGHSATRDIPIWLPVTLVYVNWLAGELGRHPITNYMNFSGVAAGRTLEQAIVSGVEELVERDATMIWWMNAQPLPSVRLTPELASVFDGTRQRGTLVHLDNEFGIPVMAGIVRDVDEGWLNIGFATRPDAAAAGLKAWTEGLTLQEGSRDLAIEKSLIRQAVDWGFASYAGLKDWRADRRYVDDYRADFRDVSDLMCQQQIFLDPRAVDAVRPWTDTPETRALDDLPSLPDRTLATYRSRIEPRGFEICYVDLTTQDVAAAGMHAARVVVPGLVPNFPAAFPMLGTGRVQRVPVDLGWRSTPLAEEDLNYWPIPHA